MAATALRRGIALWRQAGAPYETAWARLLLGEALEQQGDRKHARVEFDAARTYSRHWVQSWISNARQGSSQRPDRQPRGRQNRLRGMPRRRRGHRPGQNTRCDSQVVTHQQESTTATCGSACQRHGSGE